MLIRGWVLWVLCLGCGGAAGQREVRFPVFGRGEVSTDFLVGAWTVSLTAAEVGVGPVYFCATAGASSDLCPAAVAEFAHSATFNALDATAQYLGEGAGETATVRSVTYDFAYTWFPTQKQAMAAPGSPGGHSARFSGTAFRENTLINFVADIDLIPRFQGTRAVQGAPVAAKLEGGPVQLVIRARPNLWWQGVDFDALATLAESPIQILPGSRAYEALVLGMTANARPSFEWTAATP